jgi:hypothetical protein
VDISYSISSNAATGNRSITVTTAFGTSNSLTFTVADPTPVISSIDPSTWYAGTSKNVTITGTGFGSNPSVGITATGVSKSIQSASDTQIVLQLSVDSSASDQSNVPVTVTSSGYGGNNFVPPRLEVEGIKPPPTRRSLPCTSSVIGTQTQAPVLM